MWSTNPLFRSLRKTKIYSPIRRVVLIIELAPVEKARGDPNALNVFGCNSLNVFAIGSPLCFLYCAQTLDFQNRAVH